LDDQEYSTGKSKWGNNLNDESYSDTRSEISPLVCVELIKKGKKDESFTGK
jgi:hypothetical protein